jgi:hypothetical protein
MKRPSVVRLAGFSAVALVLAAFPPAAAPAAPARADEAFQCRLTGAGGVPEADAQTVTQLICGELKRASAGQGRFGIGLATLGRTVLVTTTREDTAASITVRVDGVEEVPVAAGRIADALVHGLAFPGTQRVDNLLEGETREAKTKKGSVKFSLGVADVESFGHGGRAAAFSLGLVYATPRFSLPAELRFGWGDPEGGEPNLDLYSISVGGRYYLSKRDLSPFLGGGLGLLGLDVSEGGSAGTEFYGSRSGVAPYLEAGVEMLRLHRGRVTFHVRADFPTAALENDVAGYYYGTPDGRPVYTEPQPSQDESRYVVPVAIGVTIAF